MAAIPFSDLYDQIRPHARRAPEPMMDLAIRRAVRDLTQKTEYRRESLMFDCESGVDWYTLTPSSSEEEVFKTRVAQFTYPTSSLQIPLAPMSQEDLGSCFGTFPQAYFFNPPDAFIVAPVPRMTVPDGFSVRAVLRPTLTATTIDDSITRAFDQAITVGALSWLLTMKDEQWTDLPLAAEFQRQYMQFRKEAMAMSDNGHQSFNIQSAVYRF